MPTKKETTAAKVETKDSKELVMPGKMSARYLSELARFSTWLSSALIIAMTFLLLAGLRQPKLPLLISLYVTLGAFGLSMLCYLVSGWISLKLYDGAELTKEQGATTRKRLNVLRKAQQIFFVIGLIALVVFVAEVSLLFFPTSSSGSTTQTP